MRIPWIHKQKEVWNPAENRGTKSMNFLDWIIVQKNVYIFGGLFEGSIKLDGQKNIL